MRILTLLLLCAAPLAAQSHITIPDGYENLEGTSAARTPFGWSSGRIQYLVDGARLCQTLALLTNIQFRLDGGNFNVDAPVGKTFQATLISYEVPLAPDAMTNTWATNIGAASGTILFQGALQIPPAARQYPYPNPWTIDIAFLQPYLYLRQNGNLLLDLEVVGGTGDNWPADGFFVHRTEARGEVTKIWEDPTCTNLRGDTLSLSVPQVLDNGVLGMQLTVQHSATPAVGGIIDFVCHFVGLDNRQSGALPLPIQFGNRGYPGCQLNVDTLVSQFVAANAGQCVWPIPASPTMLGLPLFTQAAGFDFAAGLAVPSRNAYQVRIGDVAPPAAQAQMVHQSNYSGQTTGALSPTGFYGVVLRFVGSFQ